MKKVLLALILMCMVGAMYAQTNDIFLYPTIQPSHYSGVLEYRDGYTRVRIDDRSYQLLLPKKDGLVLDVVTTTKVDVYGWLLASPKLQIVVDKMYVDGRLLMGVQTWDSRLGLLLSYPLP